MSHNKRSPHRHLNSAISNFAQNIRILEQLKWNCSHTKVTIHWEINIFEKHANLVMDINCYVLSPNLDFVRSMHPIIYMGSKCVIKCKYGEKKCCFS